jgi:hypothetical protein
MVVSVRPNLAEEDLFHGDSAAASYFLCACKSVVVCEGIETWRRERHRAWRQQGRACMCMCAVVFLCLTPSFKFFGPTVAPMEPLSDRWCGARDCTPWRETRRLAGESTCIMGCMACSFVGSLHRVVALWARASQRQRLTAQGTVSLVTLPTRGVRHDRATTPPPALFPPTTSVHDTLASQGTALSGWGWPGVGESCYGALHRVLRA